jgi:phosphatidylglycerol---prolipoprotein diacylglyceryl transferase
MHPTLFNIPLPDFLARLLGLSNIPIYSYAVCIVLGAVLACIYIRRKAKTELNIENLPNSFFYKTFLAGFVGGKLFCYLETPSFYFHHPKAFLNVFSGGFVCYGSILFIVGYFIYYSRKNNFSALKLLDILAIAGLIPIILGRLGCFLGGCCYGKPTAGFWGVVFPATSPVMVHPTQFYDAMISTFILIGLLIFNKYKKIDGQVILLNLGAYAVGRFLLEFVRGDQRGFLFNGFISHAQTTAICLLIISIGFFYKLKKQTFTNLKTNTL